MGQRTLESKQQELEKQKKSPAEGDTRMEENTLRMSIALIII